MTNEVLFIVSDRPDEEITVLRHYFNGDVYDSQIEVHLKLKDEVYMYDLVEARRLAALIIEACDRAQGK